MSHRHQIRLAGLDAITAFGRELAAAVRPGDVLLLQGDLGAGKSTLARALIHALAPAHGEFEVPSPTFTLVQHYDFTRIPVAHADFYRLGGIDEAYELGLEEAAASGLVIVEWPDRAPGLFSGSILGITLEDTEDGEARMATLTPHGRWIELLPRLAELRSFLEQTGWSDAIRTFLQGDASSRRYERLTCSEEAIEDGRFPAILMDSPTRPDGPPVRDGLPYSRIAHLAEDVRPFVAVGEYLRSRGLSAPAIFSADLDRGFLVLEDLGSRVFGEMVLSGADMTDPLSAATDVLVEIAGEPVPRELPLPDGTTHVMPEYDRRAREIEAELLIDWYYPALRGASMPDAARAAYLAAWRSLWPLAEADAGTIVLRDYHSPNLLWLPEREGLARIGIIDYQDALIGHAAYDLASLLQDARVDLAPELEPAMLERYLRQREIRSAGFDRQAFLAAYAILGAQRAAKILGIFTRLSRRDGKHGYLRHIPRIQRYLALNLGHAHLAGLRAWFDEYFPEALAPEGALVA